MSAKGKKSRKRRSHWHLTYEPGRMVTDSTFTVIVDAVAQRHPDGSWTFTDDQGLIAGYGPGVLAAVQRDLVPAHPELIEPDTAGAAK